MRFTSDQIIDELSNLAGQLRTGASSMTLGEIATIAKRSFAIAKRGRETADAVAEIDIILAERPDYRLWRNLFVPDPRTHPSSGWPSSIAIFHSGVEHSLPLVKWGIITLAETILTGKKGNYFSHAELEEIIASLEKLFYQSVLPPITNARAGCALHRFLLRAALEKARFESEPDAVVSIESIEDFLTSCEKLLSQVDSGWAVGRSVSLLGLKGERKIGVLNVFDLNLCVDQALFMVRGTARNGMKREAWEPKMLTPLRRAATFAFSSWRSSRASRIYLERHPDRGSIDHAQRNEARALVRAAQAANDAGLYCSAAKLMCWSLRTVPDSLLKDPEFSGLGNMFGYAIRSFGFEVDSRFSRKRVSRFYKKREQTPPTALVPVVPVEEHATHAHLAPEGSLGAVVADCNIVDRSIDAQNAPGNTRKARVTGAGPDYFKLRVAYEQQHDPDWQLLLRQTPSDLANPMEVLGYICFKAIGHQLDEETARAAFRLATRKYFLPKPAADLLQGFCPSKTDLLAYAELLERSMRAMPYGLDEDAYVNWQNVLRNSWEALPSSERIHVEDVLLFHEVLLGRGVAIVRGADVEGRAADRSRRLARRFFSAVPEETVRELVDTDLTLLQGTRVGADVSLISNYLRPHLRQQSSDTVMVSVAALHPRSWSILLAQRDGFHADRLQLTHNPFDEADAIIAAPGWGEAWFAIPWMMAPALRELAETIADMVQSRNPSARYVQMAIEPTIAHLPLNDLFRPLWRKRGMNVVVSIIPNLTWTLSNPQSALERGVKLIVADERALFEIGEGRDMSVVAELRELRNAIGRSYADLRQQFDSAAIVLGHGSWDPEAETTSIVAPGYQLPIHHVRRAELMDLGFYRIVVAHSCHAGRGNRQFLGDLGGLGGLALSLGSRLVAAPVHAISPRTAGVLHRHLSMPDGPSTFGLRYIAAMKEDRNVALYNLYGFGSEPVGHA